MTTPPRSDNPGDSGKRLGALMKWLLVAGIPAVAAGCAIVLALEGWFSSDGGAVAASNVVEYKTLCDETNAKQREWASNLARFRIAFGNARDPTGARDAMLLLARQDVAATVELASALSALKPTPQQASVQHRLEHDWEDNIKLLRAYSDRLSVGGTSARMLVELAATMPRATIEARAADARGLLLRLGQPACSLDAQRIQPVADWSPEMQKAIYTAGNQGAEATSQELVVGVAPAGGSSPPTVGATGRKATGSQVLPDASTAGAVLQGGSPALPDAEPPVAAASPPASGEVDHRNTTHQSPELFIQPR